MLRHHLVLVSLLVLACSTGDDGIPGVGVDTAGGDATATPNTDASGGVVVAECDDAPAGATCDADQNPCTLDSCDGAGACRPTGGVEACAAASAADPCWAHACDPAAGCRPTSLRVGEVCNDGDPCTLDDHCAEAAGASGCAGTPIDVDDGNPCTNDYCDSDAVHHAPLDAVSCTPEAACEVPGECVAGACIATRECPCVAGVDCPEPVCTVPCANGGSCVADETCDCGGTGYAGASCETPVCEPPCAQGACTAPDTCDCGDTGYSGAACDVPVCDPPCAHGACTAPDTCDCGETGYSGAACDVPVCDPPCAHGAC
ncbi:MAG: hypothetical protein IV100_15170, partial [Myxococcales bacterium]|nr:hypothetical protein [Myxococcales bacterium]